MAQHDCLVKGLRSSHLAIMAAKVQMLAGHPDIALPLLRPLVLAHTMIARGLGLQPFFFAPMQQHSYDGTVIGLGRQS